MKYLTDRYKGRCLFFQGLLFLRTMWVGGGGKTEVGEIEKSLSKIIVIDRIVIGRYSKQNSKHKTEQFTTLLLFI